MSKKIYLGIVAGVGVLLLAMLTILLTVDGGGGGVPQNVSVPPAEATPNAVAGQVAAEAAPPAETPPLAIPPASSEPNLSALPDVKLAPEHVADLRKKLRQIALGFMNYESVHREFPPGKKEAAAPKLSWRVQILPFLEQKPLYDRFAKDEPWDSPRNQALLDSMPDIFRIGNETGSNTHFVVMSGEKAFFRPNRAPNIRSCVDGTSNTLLAVNTGGGKAVPWTKPEDAVFDEANPVADIGLVNGRFEGVLVDGALISLPGEIDQATFRGLVTPNGHEIIDGAGLARKYSPNPVASVAQSSKGTEALRRFVVPLQDSQKRAHEIASGLMGRRNLTFPPAVTVISHGNDNPTSMSWRVAILPFLEQQNLYGSYKRDNAWDDSENRALFDKMPGIYSFDPQTETSLTRMQVFRGEGTAFGKTEIDADPKTRSHSVEIKNIPDGASKTILFVESGKDRAVTWTQPRDLEFDRDKPVESLGAIGPNGTIVAMMDGAVRVINSDIDPAVFR
ncbi:MAG TPA: DUF1559 domain-containing protein, partial [Lacipirellulaceae bacterium]|nr:DUF1559 domain-containing protein [Lacipirellulaceae bacterium]